MISLTQFGVILAVVALAGMLGYWVGYLIGTMNRNSYIYEQAEIKENKIVRLKAILSELRKLYVEEMRRCTMLEEANKTMYNAGYNDCCNDFLKNLEKYKPGKYGIDEEGKINKIKK